MGECQFLPDRPLVLPLLYGFTSERQPVPVKDNRKDVKLRIENLNFPF